VGRSASAASTSASRASSRGPGEDDPVRRGLQQGADRRTLGQREPQAVLVEALSPDQAVGDPEQQVVSGLVGREERHRVGEPDGRVLVAPDLHRRSVPVR